MRAPAFDKLNLDAVALQKRVAAARKSISPVQHLDAIKSTTAELVHLSERIQRAKAFRIGFVGSIKAGKSTLLTSLLNGEVLMPAAATVCTAALTCINGRKGGDPEAFAEPMEDRDLELVKMLADMEPDPRDPSLKDRFCSFFKAKDPKVRDEELEIAFKEFLEELIQLGGDLKQQIEDAKQTLKRLKQFQEGAKSDWPPDSILLRQIGWNLDLGRWASAQGELGGLISKIEIYWPCEWLPDGAVLVDTPGLQDPVPSRAKRTSEEMKRLDAVVMCIGSNIERSHTQELTRLMEYGVDPKRILVARTQIDRLNNRSDLLSIMEETRKTLATEGWKDIQVVPVCAYASAVALTHAKGLNLLAVDAEERHPEDAAILARKLEKRLGLETEEDLRLEDRLWRASNLEALVDALDDLVKANNDKVAQIDKEVENLFDRTLVALESDLEVQNARRQHLEHIVSGECPIEEISIDASRLLIKADEKDQGAFEIAEAQSEFSNFKEHVGASRSDFGNLLLSAYKQHWRREKLGGFLYKDAQVVLDTRGDGRWCANVLKESILKRASEDISNFMGSAIDQWVREEAPELESSFQIGEQREFRVWISEKNWSELHSLSKEAWREVGPRYLTALAESITDYLDFELQNIIGRMSNEKNDLEIEAKDLRQAAEIKNKELAQAHLDEAIGLHGTLESSLKAFREATATEIEVVEPYTYA